jgi:hypothetical protein
MSHKRYIIKNPRDGEQEVVSNLSLYEGWPVIATFYGELYEHHEIVDGKVVPLLDPYKAEARADINAKRDERQVSVAPTPFGDVNIDAKSRSLIAEMVTAALAAKALNGPFSRTWTMVDDSSVELDADKALQLSLAVSEYTSTVHEHSRTLKGKVEDAKSLTSLRRIRLEDGWPE